MSNIVSKILRERERHTRSSPTRAFTLTKRFNRDNQPHAANRHREILKCSNCTLSHTLTQQLDTCTCSHEATRNRHTTTCGDRTRHILTHSKRTRVRTHPKRLDRGTDPHGASQHRHTPHTASGHGHALKWSDSIEHRSTWSEPTHAHNLTQSRDSFPHSHGVTRYIGTDPHAGNQHRNKLLTCSNWTADPKTPSPRATALHALINLEHALALGFRPASLITII